MPIYIHHNDVKYLSDPELNLSNYSNPTPITVKGRIIEVHEGDHITCGAIDLTVYETPGHTPGRRMLLYAGFSICWGYFI